MKAHACTKCGRYLPKVFFTEGGVCPRCHTKVGPMGGDGVPAWYTSGLNTRPWSMPEGGWIEEYKVLRTPWDSRDLNDIGKISLEQFLNQQMGLELPDDTSKTYWPPFSEEGPEYGPVDVTSSLALRCAGQQGVDELHNALLIICGAAAGAGGISATDGIRCANLCYYMATGFCVGGDRREVEVENQLRNLQGQPFEEHSIRWLQDAVAFVFDQLGLVHTASVEYVMRDHPSCLLV